MSLKAFIAALIIISNLCSFSEGLYDVYSPGITLVYAVGTNGRTLKSTNSGNTYTQTFAGNSNLYSVFAISNYVWSAGENGTFNKSVNSGTSWDTYNLGSYNFKSVFFTDSLTGFIAGEAGAVLKSTDGGNNWQSLTSGASNNLNRIKFINQTTGFICGSNGTIIKTTTAGTSWESLAVPLTINITSIDAYSNTVIAGAGNGSLLKSTNIGGNWSIINLNIWTQPAVTGISMSSDTSFFFSLESGSIWYSFDGGNSFQYSRSPLFAEIHSLDFLFSRGYAVSKDHILVIRTLNSGQSWGFPSGVTAAYDFVTVLPLGGQSFNKILCFNNQKRGTLYALQKNLLHRSMDHGESWDLLSVLPLDDIAQQLLVSMKDSSKMLAAMNSGQDSCRIYRTSDYGANWSMVYFARVDFIGNLLTQDPSHPDTVYLGVSDSVMRSSDFGLTWTKIADYPFFDWCDLAVNTTNSNVLYAATNHYPAKLNKSTNGGLNWFTVDFVFDTLYSEMPAIATTNHNPNIIFHAQLGSSPGQTGLKRSYSQGNTWLFDIFPGSSWAVDIAKDDPFSYAYGSVSSGSPFYLTTNGGINYFSPSNQYAEQILFYDKSNLYVTDGSEIYKMEVVYNMPIGINVISTNIPNKFMLYQNYPNPFNPVTKIRFDLAQYPDLHGNVSVELKVYDILGAEAAVLLNEPLQPGVYEVDFDGTNFASGIYFYVLRYGTNNLSRKMILIK